MARSNGSTHAEAPGADVVTNGEVLAATKPKRARAPRTPKPAPLPTQAFLLQTANGTFRLYFNAAAAQRDVELIRDLTGAEPTVVTPQIVG